MHVREQAADSSSISSRETQGRKRPRCTTRIRLLQRRPESREIPRCRRFTDCPLLRRISLKGSVYRLMLTVNTFSVPGFSLTIQLEMTYCAIDFGTSNSAVAVPRDGMMHLALVEGVHRTLPTAVFFNADEQVRAFVRAALAAYIDG